MSFAELVAAADRVALDVFGDKSDDGAPLPVLYQPENGVAVPVNGIFSEEYILAKGSAEAGVESLGPAVFFRLEDLPVDPQDDEPTLTIRGNDYKVTERRPDGMGGIVLAVRRKS